VEPSGGEAKRSRQEAKSQENEAWWWIGDSCPLIILYFAGGGMD
jgi:hypothetical protein